MTDYGCRDVCACCVSCEGTVDKCWRIRLKAGPKATLGSDKV